MSPRDVIARYLRERARPTALAALSLVMAGAGWASHDATRMTVVGFALAALASFVLVLSFRVWDDVEDGAYDAARHPSRITVIVRTAAPLRRLACALFVLGASLILATPNAALRLCVLCVSALLLAVWYRARSPSQRGLANAHVVLLKYPVIAFAAAPVTPSLTALAALYLGLCVHEVAHDPSLRESLAARRLAISEVALVSTIIAGATLLGGRLP